MRSAGGQASRTSEPTAPRPLTEAVRGVASHGLPEIPPVGTVAVPDHVLPAFLREVVAGRLTGLAVLALEAGALELTEAGVAQLRADDATWASHTLRAEDVMLDSAGRLEAAGIPCRVLKGSALADRAWAIGQARRWVDADLLVPEGDVDDAVRVLTEAGARRRVPELRPGFDRRFAKSVTMRSASGPEIDLHRTLVLGPHTFLVPTEDLWSPSQHLRVDGRDLETLGTTATFVHLCMHATITGEQRLATLRDVVESSRHADLADAADLASRWRATPAVELAVRAASRRLGLGEAHPLAQWAMSLEAPRGDVRLFSAYEGTNRSARRLAIEAVWQVPGIGDRLRYARAMLWPDRASRRARGRSASAQLRHIMRRRP